MSNVHVLLTIGQIEQRFGYSQGSLASMRAKGYFIPPAQTYGRVSLWREDDVLEWMIAKGREARTGA